MMRAVLLSGGMDSTALCWWQRPDIAIFVNYGQIPAIAEGRAAREIADELGIRLETVSVDCSSLGTGLLAGSRQLPGSPTSEWWPYRNQLLATLAGSVCARHNVTEMMIGTVLGDEKHSDGSHEFVRTLDSLFALQEGHLRFTAPAISLDTKTLIKISLIPDEILAWTHSCFVSDTPCMKCRGCGKHLSTLNALGKRPA
jgi:7-cyano-7-deazaguanine synthase